MVNETMETVTCSVCGDHMKIVTCTEADVSGDSAKDNTTIYEWLVCDACGYYEVLR